MIFTNEFLNFKSIDLNGIRTIQVMILSIIAMTVCQLLKFLIFSIKEHKLMFKTLMTTGGMPSSHTATVVTLVSSMAMFQLHDYGTLNYSFAVALIFATIIIHDAMGIRLESGKHAKILNNLVADKDLEVKKDLGYGKHGKLKELLGHKLTEVFGGFLLGLLVGIVGYFIIVAFL